MTKACLSLVGLRRICLVLLAVVSLPLAAGEGWVETGEDLSLPAKGMKPTQPEAAIRDEHKKKGETAAQKLRQAELLFRIGRWHDCIAVCDQILVSQPSHKAARNLKKRATQQQLKVDTENLDAESQVRDNAALRLVTKDGHLPHRKTDLPRPILDENKVPFNQKEQIPDAGRDILKRRIPELNLIDTDLNYVLQILFKATGVNIIYNPEDIQDKTVTIHARDLTLEDILKYLSRSYDIGYTVDKGTIWVYAADNETAEHALMRPVIIPLKHGLTFADSPQGAGNIGEGGGGEEGQEGQNEDIGGPSDIEIMMTWMEDNWPGWPAESKWTIDKKLNRLIIASTPDIVEEVRRMVNMLDVPPIQILVTARFVDVQQGVVDQLGFNWTATPGSERQVPSDPGRWDDNKIRPGSTNVNLGVGADALTSGAVAILNNYQLNFALQALEQTTATKLVSAPRVIAMNNHSAEIKLESSLPYQSDVRTETVTTSNDSNSTSSTTLIPVWETEDIGWRLKVIPSVGSDMKTISLRVSPTIREQDGQVKETIIVTVPQTDESDTSQSFDIFRPIIKTQSLTVDATINDGQTLVVGGLTRDSNTEIDKRVPWLSDLPGVGKMFRSKDNKRERKCLLIFVTARIVTPGNRHYTDNREEANRLIAEERTLAGEDADLNLINEWLGDPKENDRVAPTRP